jgi:hypothetical protein
MNNRALQVVGVAQHRRHRRQRMRAFGLADGGVGRCPRNRAAFSSPAAESRRPEHAMKKNGKAPAELVGEIE